jgi:hypothetical protein
MDLIGAPPISAKNAEMDGAQKSAGKAKILEVSDRVNLCFEVYAFSPFRQEKAKGWGTELVQERAAGDLGAHSMYAKR